MSLEILEEFSVTHEKVISNLINYTLQLMADTVNKTGKIESKEMLNH